MIETSPNAAGSVRSTTAATRWGLAAAILTVGTFLSATLAAVLLDTLVRRPPGAGSITRLLPGFVYATATVMKVSIVAGLVSAAAAIATRVLGVADDVPKGVSTCALASVALTSVAPLAGTMTVLVAQFFAGATTSEFTYVSRTAVFVQMLVIAGGVTAAALALMRRERPLLLSVLGLAVNALLIALFWHLEFYAVGFDQDTWAPR